MDLENNFNKQDVKEKCESLGNKCYLSGLPLSLDNPDSYTFDHIIPVSKNGTNHLDNLGFANPQINQMKGDLSVEEFINLCKIVTDYNT